jgi:hypothetical protein
MVSTPAVGSSVTPRSPAAVLICRGVRTGMSKLTADLLSGNVQKKMRGTMSGELRST